jgi:hypothetical protein
MKPPKIGSNQPLSSTYHGNIMEDNQKGQFSRKTSTNGFVPKGSKRGGAKQVAMFMGNMENHRQQ